LSVSRRLCGPTTSCFALFAYVPARHGFALACRFECLRAARCFPPWQLISLSVDSFGSWFPWKLIPLLLCSPHGMLATFSCFFFCLNEYIAATVSSSHINPRVYSFQVGAPCLWWRRCLVWFRFFSNPAHRLLNLSCGNKGMLKGCRLRDVKHTMIFCCCTPCIGIRAFCTTAAAAAKRKRSFPKLCAQH